MTDASFESIDHDDQPGVGPRALLLSGFATEEVSAVRGVLESVGAPDFGVRRCSEAMLSVTLEEALGGAAGGAPVPADKLPRVVILSGEDQPCPWSGSSTRLPPSFSYTWTGARRFPTAKSRSPSRFQSAQATLVV